MINRTPLYLVLAIAVVLSSLPALVSCNKDKDSDDDSYSYSTSTQTTLVTGFALQTDADVLASLDSVHFTVDYDNGLIYNADSLPVGTDVSSLKVTVEFLNTVKSAVFDISGATKQADTTISYTASMTQALDFTGKTTLTVTSADESLVKKYEVKVLVHKLNPDSLIWDKSWRRDLPGYSHSAQGHKAVKQGDLYRIMMYNGELCNLWTAQSPSQGTWERKPLSLPFVPQVATLTATGDALYILADDGTLYTSTDGSEWSSCGVNWYSLLGAYDDRVLGIMSDGANYYHDEFPRGEDFEATVVEDGFPVSHSSGVITTDNEWTISQQVMIVGGVNAQGELIADVWGYDGSRWGRINNSHSQTLPAIADATVFPYYTYKTLSGVRRYARQVTWYLMGGRLADGTLNDKIYLSSTLGVTWTEGGTSISQPSYMPKFYGAQAFVADETLTRAAQGMPRRVSSPVITWECPYIYLMGGYNDQGALLPYVWRGVYNRLTNVPVY